MYTSCMAKPKKPPKPTPPNPAIAKRIKAIRDRLGLSNAALADRLGITERALHSYLYGQRSPSAAVLKLITLLEAGKL